MTMSMRHPLPFGLTLEQKKLFDRVVPQQVDRAAGHVIREYKVKDQEDDIKQEGTIAIGTGLPRFDPVTYQTPVEQWALYVAMYAMLQVVRVERRFQQQIAAMRLAVTLHCAFETGTFDARVDGVEEARVKMTAYAQRLAMGTLVRLAATPIAVGGEHDVVVEEAQRRILDVMQRLVAELRPQQRDLLQRAFAYDHVNVKKAAEEIGEQGYRAALRVFHEVLELLGARFAGEGFHADNLPPWPDAASGTILGQPAETARGHQP